MLFKERHGGEIPRDPQRVGSSFFLLLVLSVQLLKYTRPIFYWLDKKTSDWKCDFIKRDYDYEEYDHHLATLYFRQKDGLGKNFGRMMGTGFSPQIWVTNSAKHSRLFLSDFMSLGEDVRKAIGHHFATKELDIFNRQVSGT